MDGSVEMRDMTVEGRSPRLLLAASRGYPYRHVSVQNEGPAVVFVSGDYNASREGLGVRLEAGARIDFDERGLETVTKNSRKDWSPGKTPGPRPILWAAIDDTRRNRLRTTARARVIVLLTR